MSDADDLIRRYCRKGDQEAFRRFYGMESRRLWRFLVARGATTEDAYDFVAEAFLRFLQTVCRDPAAPKALLYRIALNLKVDAHRRTQTAVAFNNHVADDVAAGPAEGEAVRRLLGRLHADEQNLLLMRYWIGFTHAEIAATLELPEGTVRRQAAAALHKLRTLLGED